LSAFVEHNPKRALPDHFFIFRDGVGDGMRRMILEKEISQFKEVIEEVYNKAANKPHMTVVVVNKRINQRFFVKDAQGNTCNPPSGCIIDN